MEITTSLDQYQFFDTIFDPPNFSLDTPFNSSTNTVLTLHFLMLCFVNCVFNLFHIY